MKKIFALALLLGLGMMVGCGDDAKKPAGTTAKPTTAAAKDTGTPAAPADTAKK